jgi:hypothetical protein
MALPVQEEWATVQQWVHEMDFYNRNLSQNSNSIKSHPRILLADEGNDANSYAGSYGGGSYGDAEKNRSISANSTNSTSNAYCRVNVGSFCACKDSCMYANDGECDDGGGHSMSSICQFGHDCTDCGFRLPDEPPKASACVNSGGNPKCDEWAANGDCSPQRSSYQYMKKSCEKSCKYCDASNETIVTLSFVLR